MKRIQRKRTKGWKMPENTVYVGRPTMWGNPFKLVEDIIYVDASHRRKILDPWVVYYEDDRCDNYDVVELFRDMLMSPYSHDVEEPIRDKFNAMRDRIRDLHGKNLACFCKEGEPCHADVLMELANSWSAYHCYRCWAFTEEECACYDGEE